MSVKVNLILRPVREPSRVKENFFFHDNGKAFFFFTTMNINYPSIYIRQIRKSVDSLPSEPPRKPIKKFSKYKRVIDKTYSSARVRSARPRDWGQSLS